MDIFGTIKWYKVDILDDWDGEEKHGVYHTSGWSTIHWVMDLVYLHIFYNAVEPCLEFLEFNLFALKKALFMTCHNNVCVGQWLVQFWDQSFSKCIKCAH